MQATRIADAAVADRRDAVRRRAGKWRFLSLGGGLLLAASFFMPAINACNAPQVPAANAYEVLGEPRLWATWPAYFYWFVAAYAFGFLVALGAGLRLVGSPLYSRAIRTCVFILLLGGIVVALWIFVLEVWNGWPTLPPRFTWTDLWAGMGAFIVLVVLPLFAAFHLVRTRRLRRRRWLGHGFVASLWCITWFGMYLVEAEPGDIHYGLPCSFAASLAVFIGIVGETAALTNRTFFRALGGLMIGRVPRLEEDRGRCEGCDYLLAGLTVNRCPECNRPFAWEDVGLSPPCESVPSA